jgi:hypothetical protein
MIFAGIPPTTTLSGTSLETTEPAATTEFSPIVTPCNMVAPAPIQAFFLIWMGLGTSECLRSGEIGWLSESKLTFGAISTPSSMVIPPRSKKMQSKLINTFNVYSVSCTYPNNGRIEFQLNVLWTVDSRLWTCIRIQNTPNLVHVHQCGYT